jgi:hypothetical protein
MKFAVALASIALLPFTYAAVAGTLATTTVAYDTVYDNGSNSLDIVACSDGENGLEAKGFSTFGSLPKFPLIGSASAVEGYDSNNCGTCWQLSYTNKSGSTKSVYMLAIDHTDSGFVLSKAGMNTLTNNQATKLGRVNVTYKKVAESNCGL